MAVETVYREEKSCLNNCVKFFRVVKLAKNTTTNRNPLLGVDACVSRGLAGLLRLPGLSAHVHLRDEEVRHVRGRGVVGGGPHSGKSNLEFEENQKIAIKHAIRNISHNCNFFGSIYNTVGPFRPSVDLFVRPLVFPWAVGRLGSIGGEEGVRGATATSKWLMLVLLWSRRAFSPSSSSEFRKCSYGPRATSGILG